MRLMNWATVSSLEDGEIEVSGGVLSDADVVISRTVEENVQGFAEMVQITLIASWTTIDGQAHSRRFVTRYAKNGLYDYYYADVSN